MSNPRQDKKIMECIPNVSEGQNPSAIREMERAIAKTPGLLFLDTDSGLTPNRTVFSFAGPPEAVFNAALELGVAASRVIDMRVHHGSHPRMGAIDVCPLVPLRRMTMEECVQCAHILGERMAKLLNVPVYFYGEAALDPGRKDLSRVRKGGYEALAVRQHEPGRQPDCGPSDFNPAWGATVVGARKPLLAYNINIRGTDPGHAKRIARLVSKPQLPDGTDAAVYHAAQSAGLALPLPGVKAIGWSLEEFSCSQVAMNLADSTITTMADVFNACTFIAGKIGAEIEGSELVGLTELAGICALTPQGHAAGQSITLGLEDGIAARKEVERAHIKFGLSSVKPFVPEKKIIEYLLGEIKW